MIQLPGPHKEEFTPSAQPVSGGMRSISDAKNTVRLALDNLQPGHKLTVTISANVTRADPGPAFLIVADVPVAPIDLDGPHSASVTVTAESSILQITWTNVASVTVADTTTIIDNTILPPNPLPAHVLGLHALLPIPGLDMFRLGVSRLGRNALDRPGLPPELFRLGVSRLGARRLHYPAALMSWQDLLPSCTQITTWRGVDAHGPIKTAKAGTLTAVAVDALDPRSYGIHHGTPIRLIHWPTRTTIFTGSTTNLKITPNRPGSRIAYAATLTAADSVAPLSAITRYGAKSGTTSGQEAWTDRINRLFQSSTITPVITRTGSNVTLTPTVWETSLAAHIDAAVASAAGRWHVDRHGQVQIADGTTPFPDSGLAFIDDDHTNLDKGRWSYTGIDNAWTAADSLTAITASNHAAALTDGEWRADDVEITVADPAAPWEGTTGQVNTTLPTSSLTPLLESLLRRATLLPPPSKVTLTVAAPHAPKARSAHMQRAATLDPLTLAAVTNRHETTKALISSVAHSITPQRWTTDLALTTP